MHDNRYNEKRVVACTVPRITLPPKVENGEPYRAALRDKPGHRSDSSISLFLIRVQRDPIVIHRLEFCRSDLATDLAAATRLGLRRIRGQTSHVRHDSGLGHEKARGWRKCEIRLEQGQRLCWQPAGLKLKL